MKRWRYHWLGVMIGGVVLAAMVSVAWASSNATVPQNKYQVAKIEINIYGNPPRCVVIFWAYYGGELHVIDWRYCEDVGIKYGISWDGRVLLSGKVPELINGCYYLMWDDQGVPRTVVTCEKPYVLPTPGDHEMAERDRLPNEKRPKLDGGGYSSSPYSLPAPYSSPTVELVDPIPVDQ